MRKTSAYGCAFVRSLVGVALVGTLATTLTACGSSGFSDTKETDTTTIVVPPPQQSEEAEQSGPQPTFGASQESGGVAEQADSLHDSQPTVRSETFTHYEAQGNASEPFAQAVFNAFVANYNATGETAPTLSVASPTTGQTYTMSCMRPQGRGVGCVGGDNAAVLIY